jgi:hypothetical protein
VFGGSHCGMKSLEIQNHAGIVKLPRQQVFVIYSAGI